MLHLIDSELLAPEIPDPRYIGTPFEHIKLMGPKVKGSRFEKITDCILKKLGHSVVAPNTTDFDRIINKKRTEIKGSLLDKGKKPKFSFLQIRPNQEYDQILFAMFYPDKVDLVVMPKSLVVKHIENGVFKKQHAGKKGESGTYAYYGTTETLLAIGGKIFKK